jgi:uncharacterized protein YbjT (DUF2867 family)
MKVILTGATGMVGKGVLLECLEHPDISEVFSISRRSLAMHHAKLIELIHADFSEFASVSEHLEGYDACYACMGVSSAGMKEAEYTRLTYEYTLALARQLYKSHPEMTFTYVSGQGTDSSEKGRIMWARVKGKTENDLLNLGFKQAIVFRPGAIIPVKGVQPSSKLYRVLIKNLSWLIWLMKKVSPDSVVSSAEIGQAMINVSQKGYSKNVLNPKDIQILANTSK